MILFPVVLIIYTQTSTIYSITAVRAFAFHHNMWLQREKLIEVGEKNYQKFNKGEALVKALPHCIQLKAQQLNNVTK